jgi:hypothetical protein
MKFKVAIRPGSDPGECEGRASSLPRKNHSLLKEPLA